VLPIPPGLAPPARVLDERTGPVLAFILFLIILWIVLGLIGAIVHGLFWLLIIAAVLFVATLVFGGGRLGRRSRP
jgi:hypothetical protein